MPKYERSGKVAVPQWWLDKVLPILDSKGVSNAEIARLASKHAGRKSPWTSPAISKFKDGSVRTIELTNGISAALQVPQPFHTAPDEAAAVEMALIANRARDRAKQSSDEQPAQDDRQAQQAKKLAAYDGMADRELTTVRNSRRR